MSRVCQISGKKTHAGRQFTKRGLAKAKGGVGKKITSVTNRTFRPNLQKIRVLDGKTPRRAYVCTRCIKAGKVTKAV